MKRQAHSSPKLAALTARLGLRKYQAVGLLEALWHFTATQAQRGDIGKWTDAQIAAAVDWEREPSELIQSLVDAGWIDRCLKHRLLIHDWADHADQTVQRSPIVREHGFAVRSVSGGRNPSDSLASDASATSDDLAPDASTTSDDLVPDASTTSGPLDSQSPEPASCLLPPEPEPEPVARARPARRRTQVPEKLTSQELEGLRAWCREKHPEHLSQLEALVEQCLDHHRGAGNLKADWGATCRNWIRREHPPKPKGAPGTGSALVCKHCKRKAHSLTLGLCTPCYDADERSPLPPTVERAISGVARSMQ